MGLLGVWSFQEKLSHNCSEVLNLVKHLILPRKICRIALNVDHELLWLRNRKNRAANGLLPMRSKSYFFLRCLFAFSGTV